MPDLSFEYNSKRKKMTCIIIDDEESARLILGKLCAKMNDLEVKGIFQSAADALDFLCFQKVDIVFLDICMPTLSGFDFIESLKSPPKVILTTSNTNLVIKGFEYRCVVDYLGKPLKFPRFVKALHRAAMAVKAKKNSELKKQKENYNNSELYVRIKNKLVRIDISKIVYIHSYNNSICIHTNTNSYTVQSSFIKLLEKLPENFFVKIHKAFIINITYISNVHNASVELVKGVVPIEPSLRGNLIKKLNLF